MSKLVTIRAGAEAPERRLAVPFAWRDVLFVIAVAAVSVVSSLAMTIAQLGFDPSAFSTAVIVPLVVSVPVATYLVRQRARIAALNAQLNELVRRDPLTGLLNRRAFMVAAEAGPDGGSLVLIDADRFKMVNDTWGHPAGDSVLIEMAARLGRVAGPTAVLGRIGGEEFAVFLPGFPFDAGLAKAEELRRIVAASPIPHGSLSIACTISLGLALVTSAGLPAAITEADVALYRAKALGRNRVCPADPTLGGRWADCVPPKAAVI